MDAINKIYIGEDIAHPLFSFSGDFGIEAIQLVLSSSMSGDELAIDQFMPVVYDAGYIQVDFIPQGSDGLTTADGKIFQVYPFAMFLDKLPYGTPIWYYNGETLIGKFYSQRITRTGKTKFEVLAVSSVGVLDGLTHNGGIYTGQTFQTVASDIIGNTVSFSCASDVASIPVFGWLPKASKRANLHQLLFACGVSVAKGADGDVIFQFPDTTEIKDIPDNRIFVGGSMDYKTPASRADITEHAFMKLPTDETVTLFDNTDGSGVADHTTVDFQDAPVYDISAEGLTIHESGVNHAVVSGTGVLTGRKYTHTTKIISLQNDAGGKEKTVSVTDATLVSVANSDYVARRVLSFYASAKTVSADIIVKNEKPGDQVAFTNPFDEPENAFLSSMDITVTSIMRASCELITDYVPKWFGNIYSHVIVLTGSGFWEKPEGAILQGRVVLIGGGSGGGSGGSGEEGVSGWTTLGNPGKGGVAGQAGLGGKILSVTIDFEKVSGFSYACGTGGNGGVANGSTSVVLGEAGGATTFGDYSSENGAYSVSGCVNLFTGVIYGMPGMDGIAGGDGCSKDNDGQEVVGPDGTVYFPGQRGQYRSKSGSGYSCWGEGGNGGGAAVGSNGGDGGNGQADSNQGNGYGTGGDGGDGASAANGTDGASYGCGGNGGHGGGGGGVGGEAYCSNGRSYYNYGSGGTGGTGGNGGKGSDGCILIYY